MTIRPPPAQEVLAFPPWPADLFEALTVPDALSASAELPGVLTPVPAISDVVPVSPPI